MNYYEKEVVVTGFFLQGSGSDEPIHFPLHRRVLWAQKSVICMGYFQINFLLKAEKKGSKEKIRTKTQTF
jgi:hypothetical protein